ncbi:hypothetical protein [Flavobacterium sp.]|uniref:hypothetical protein n=1 Tax=Flavobacterium sp. TaxID=239 RepID=UPI002FD96CA8
MKAFKLDNEPKIASGFTTPDGYFDTFSAKLLTQLPKQEPKVISIFRVTKAWYYAAVAILILMLSVPLYNQFASHKEEVDSATLEEYLAYNSNLSEDEIVNLLDKEDLEKMKVEFNVQDKEIEDALDSNTNLEQYILD